MLLFTIRSIIKQIQQEVATELAGAGGGGAAWAVEAANLANLRSRAIEVLFYLVCSLNKGMRGSGG